MRELIEASIREEYRGESFEPERILKLKLSIPKQAPLRRLISVVHRESTKVFQGEMSMVIMFQNEHKRIKEGRTDFSVSCRNHGEEFVISRGYIDVIKPAFSANSDNYYVVFEAILPDQMEMINRGIIPRGAAPRMEDADIVRTNFLEGDYLGFRAYSTAVSPAIDYTQFFQHTS